MTFFAFVYKISFIFYTTAYHHDKRMETNGSSSSEISQENGKQNLEEAS